jgi:hypothetical protein
MSRLRTVVTFVAVLAVLVTATTPLHAHDVVVEQIVDIDMQAQARQLDVRLRVPASALGEAKIPQQADGTFDESAVGPLRIAAADISRNLDLRQGDVTVAPQAIAVQLDDDRRFVDIGLTYAIEAEASGLSARLNMFSGTALNPVRTNLRYSREGGPILRLSTTGAPARVPLNPSALEVVQQFIGRAVRTALDGGDPLLFLACLLVPMRRARSAASLVGRLLQGQLTVLAIRFVATRLYPDASAVLALIAASAVVVVALQNIVSAGPRWTGLLALFFGYMTGWALGDVFIPARQFAGAHEIFAGVIFLATILGSEIWLAAVIWGTRSWLDGLGLSNALVVVFASVVIGHTAIHRVMARADALAQTGSWAGDHALTLIVIGWSGVMLSVAAAAALRHREVGSSSTVFDGAAE